MLLEINCAVTYILSWLKGYPSVITDEQSEQFIIILSNLLQNKYQGHWNVHYPSFGSGYRAISSCSGQVDQILLLVAQEIKLSKEELTSRLPKDFTLWIDPMTVSCRIGEYGYPMTIWAQQRNVSPYLPKHPSPLRISMMNDRKMENNYIDYAIPVDFSVVNQPSDISL